MARTLLARCALCAAYLPPEPRFRRDGCRLPGGRDCRRDRAVQHRACGIAGSLPVHRQRAARQDWHARQGQAARSGGHGATACRSATERRPGRRLRLDRLGHDAERRGPPRIGAHAVPFSKRSERARGAAPPRARLQRGGRAGGRAAPAGRGAHVSVLAATLRRAARGRGADPPFEPRALHRDWRVATSVLPDGAGDCRSPACDVRSERRMGRPGPSGAERHPRHRRAATSAALRPVRQGDSGTLSERRASVRTKLGRDTVGRRLRADAAVDLRVVHVAAPARLRERLHPAVGAWDVPGARVRRAGRHRRQSWTVDAAAPRGIAAPRIQRRRTGRCGELLGPAGRAQAPSPQCGSGRGPHGRTRQRAGLALQCGPCDGVGTDLWTVTGLVVFAPAPDVDDPDDGWHRKPASASPPARRANIADGAVVGGHRRGRPGADRPVPDLAWLRSPQRDHRCGQPSRERLQGMGRPRRVL